MRYRFPSPSFPHPCRRGMTLMELLMVIGIIAVLFVLGATAFRGLAGVNLSTSAAKVQAILAKGRQLALSSNKYTQVRFYKPQGSTGGYTGIGLLVADSPYYKGTPAEYNELMARKAIMEEGPVEYLPEAFVIAEANSSLLDRLKNDGVFTRTGTSTLRDQQYEWIAFYFRPNGATDFQEINGTALETADAYFSIVGSREFEASKPALPANYATFTVSAANGYVNLIRP